MNYMENNEKVLKLLSDYLNYCPRALKAREIKNVSKCGVSVETAVCLLLTNYLNIKDKELIDEYFTDMLHLLQVEEYLQNPYLKNIKIDNILEKGWRFKKGKYTPFELFICDDFIIKGEKIIPKIGFFDRTFEFPAVTQKGRTWMTITPNEINTMKEPIYNAFGNVLTFGLGLGYFAYMIGNKSNVSSVTIIERNATIIELFKKYILPQFECRDKIKIIQSDAFKFIKSVGNNDYDYIFVDIYRDVFDGIEVYRNFKQYEKKLNKIKFDYWIEKSIRCCLTLKEK